MTPAAPRRDARRALSLLEALLATTLLGMAVSGVVGAVGAVQRMSEMDQHRLNATEVAHQLILQYLHDPNQLPDPSLPIEQGKGRYRYLISEEALTQEQEIGRVQTRRARSFGSLSQNERLGAGLVMITVKVYPDSESSLSRSRELASLSRIFDPYSSTDDDTLLRHIEQIMGESLNIPIDQR